MDHSAFPPIPMDTARAARAVFGRNNLYITAGDNTSQLLGGIIFEDTSAQLNITATSTILLHLITLFQFMETLPDQLAADALRERLDWKYALHLPLNNTGIQAGILCPFRRWLRIDTTRQNNLQMLFERLTEISGFPRSRQSNTDANQIITVICQITRLVKIWEAFNQAMEALAARHPKWLLANSLPHWYEAYSQYHKSLNLSADAQRISTLAQAIGADGSFLLEKVSQAEEPELANINEIRALRQVWVEQFELSGGNVSWRNEICAGCSSMTRLTFPLNFVG